MEDYERTIVPLPTAKLFEYFCFDIQSPWAPDGPVTHQEIDVALAENKYPTEGMMPLARADNLRIIVELVRNGLDTQNHPISIDVTHTDGDLSMVDGCHRLYAAEYVGDKEIYAELGGYVDCIDLWLAQEVD